LNGTNVFYAYDANGNVTDLVDNNGDSVAHYEYDPFGGTIVQSGIMAEANPYRFSTKYFDENVEFYYYGLRYYSPELGRWPNRDPIGENGGINLYVYLGNGPISDYDIFGLVASKDEDVVKKTRKWVKKKVADPSIKRRFPLAHRLMEHWLDGSGDTLKLTASEVDMILTTSQGKSAMSKLDGKLIAECIRREAAGESLSFTISFAGAPARGGKSVKENFTYDTSDDAKHNLFLAFHNIYFDGNYSGECCRGKNGMVLRGSAEYKIWDWYGFANRPLHAVKLPGAPSDADMWQLQQYGEASAFNVEGVKKYDPIVIPPGASVGGATPPPSGGGGGWY
jgi:RHS repeat-associated protein